MNKLERKPLDIIQSLFESERLSVLSSQSKDQPYASLVAYAASPDLRSIYFLTPRTTRKYNNIKENPKVALLINNSQNKPSDIYKSESVTIIGSARKTEGEDKEKLLNIYLKRHPQLKDFAESPTTAAIHVSISRYILVNRFQNVMEIRMEP